MGCLVARTPEPLREARRLNGVLQMLATVQLRNPTEVRAYFDRKKAAVQNHDDEFGE